MPMPDEQFPELQGECPFTQRAPRCCVAHGRFCEEAWEAIADKLRLSPGEVKVCREVVAGKPDKEIARALGVSSNTVQTHLKRLYKKRGIQNRTQLTTQVCAAYGAWLRGSHSPVVCHQKS